IGSQIVGAIDVLLQIGCREDHNQQAFDVRVRAGPLKDLETIGAGHLQIEQEQIRQWIFIPVSINPVSAQIINGLAAVLHDLEGLAQTRLLKSPLNEEHVVGVILGQKNELSVQHIASR